MPRAGSPAVSQPTTRSQARGGTAPAVGCVSLSAAASSRRRAWLRNAKKTPSGLHESGWVLLRGELSQRHAARLASTNAGESRRVHRAERALAKVLSFTRVRNLQRVITRKMLVRRPAEGFLFKKKNQPDLFRRSYNHNNGGVHKTVHEVAAQEVASVMAHRLFLGGRMFDNSVSVIVSERGASTQAEHADTDLPGAYSLLIPVTSRWIHVKDMDSGFLRTLRMRAGDMLVLSAGCCHMGHAHNLLRPSLLLFAAWNWQASDSTLVC